MGATRSSLDHLTRTLAEGRPCETQLGLFFLHDMPGYEGRNPRTGQAVRVAPIRMLYLLVSDRLSLAVLGPDFRTEAEALSVFEEDLEGLSVPTTGEPADLAEIYDLVVAGLLEEGEIEVEDLGEFVVRSFHGTTRRAITFRPSDVLRDRVNEALDRE